MGAPFAHVAGMPIEETIGSLGPAVLALAGAAAARLNSLIRKRNKGES